MSEAVAEVKTTSIPMEEEGIDLKRQIVIVASMYSFLKSLEVDSIEIREHLYDLLAEWVTRTKYIYINGLIELSTYKKREIDDLIDIYGEKGLEVILELLEDGVCKMEKEEESLRALIEDLEVDDRARERIIELAKSKGCWGIRSASIALLITPKKG